MKEYAFDIVLTAVARVKAPNEKKAREALEQINCLDLSAYTFGKVGTACGTITECSISDCDAVLFGIDGREV